MIAGVVYGISKSSLLETRVLGLLILALMLSLELALNRLASSASFSDSQTGLRTRWGSESKSSRRCSMLLP
jgi:hypothetical protein